MHPFLTSEKEDSIFPGFLFISKKSIYLGLMGEAWAANDGADRKADDQEIQSLLHIF